MKYLIISVFLLVVSMHLLSQNNPGQLPPGYLEQMKKNLPPGVQLPPEMIQMMNQAQGQGNATGEDTNAVEPLIHMPPVQQYSFANDPSPKTDYSPFGSGRNAVQRKAALMAVEAELNAKPMMLPKPESIPTVGYMLKMASERSKWAKQKFSPDELYHYSQVVTWVPQFDGKQTDELKAKQLSLMVSLSTNNNPEPYFNIALASAVFSLNAMSSSGANNLASAILSGGELITEKQPTPASLAVYRRDAEFGFLYAVFHSMKNDTWSEESLVPVINLGNLCIDLGKLEEARSLFMVARKIKPESWDAAMGLAAYFIALNQKDKALAVLEDENLDVPEKYGIPIKHNKGLEKSEEYSDLPLESPDEKYQAGIGIMAAEPVATSADFLAQIDQSERNKMRYFIENLPVKGSYSAPPIKKLTQYSTVKAISSPQGISALNDFADMMAVFSLGSFASTANTQLELLEKFGLKVDPGVDMDDVAKHPEKYMNSDLKPNVKVTGKDQFMAQMEDMKRDAQKAQQELALGNFDPMMTLAAKIDAFHAILQINPEDYADPMNIIFQKMNYTVYNRKNNLYRGYLYSLNKKTYRIVTDEIEKYSKSVERYSRIQTAELEEIEKQEEAAKKQANALGSTFPEAEWKLRKHAVHVKFFNSCNNAAEIGYGSSTNIVSTFYVQKFKPNIEGFYYDVFRHVAMISDPEVRRQKDADLRNSMNQAMTWYLNSVLMAHSAFRYNDEWDCGCDLESLLAQREAEQEALDAEENARIERNKAAKAVFDSGEIPESSPLYKKLDSYVSEQNYGFLVKVRTSCARTTVEINTDWLSSLLKIPVSLNYKSTTSEFTGASTRNGGVKVGVSQKMGAGKVDANLNLSVSVSSDGKGVVKDYSVTAGADAGVSVGGYRMSTGADVNVQGNQSGVTNYSVTENVNVSAKYGQTSVSGGASVTAGTKGVDSDFSAKISQDFKNEVGTEGKATFEASTKRGCSLSGKVEQTLTPVKNAIEGLNKKIEDKSLEIPSDLATKELWSGKFDFTKMKGSFTK